MTTIKEVDFSIPAKNIPRMLRERADAIEQGEPPLCVVLVEYWGDGETKVYGYGGLGTPGQAYMVLDHGKNALLEMGV